MSTMTRNVKNETRGKWQNRYDKVQIRKLDSYNKCLWVWWASSYGLKDEWVRFSSSLNLILTSMITYSKINLPEWNHMMSPIPKKSKIMDTIWYPDRSEDRIRSHFSSQFHRVRDLDSSFGISQKDMNEEEDNDSNHNYQKSLLSNKYIKRVSLHWEE